MIATTAQNEDHTVVVTSEQEKPQPEQLISVYEAIRERYSYDDNELSESLKNFSLLFNCKNNGSNEQSGVGTSPPTGNSQQQTADSPRKLTNSQRAIVINNKDISHVGTREEILELGSKYPNVIDLDLSFNKLKRCDQILHLLEAFKNLKFLNLSSNPSLCGNDDNEELNEEIPKTIDSWSCVGHNLSTLILNHCFVEFDVIEQLLGHLPNLNELYLAHNNYERVNFSPGFLNSNLRILYFNNNKVGDWHEVLKLGAHFEQLETLVLSENPIDGIKPRSSDEDQLPMTGFRQLKQLTLNKLNLTQWSDLEHLRQEFAAKTNSLKHLKIRDIPLLNDIKSTDIRFGVLLAYFGEGIEQLNGSPVGVKERNSGERRFLRYFMDRDESERPARYYELEAKHGKLCGLADVNFAKDMFADVKIKYGEKNVYEKIDTRQTVHAFKVYLEKYMKVKAANFRLFYIDREMAEAFGRDELKLPNIPLSRLHVKSGDEFEVEVKNGVGRQDPLKNL